MRCRNGAPHTHETTNEARACWNVRPQAVTTRPAAAKPEPATEGMYRKDGVIYKVVRAIHGSGRLYAQRLDGETFTKADGMINRLTQADRMTVAEAAEYGALYGRCVRCQTELTKDKSFKRGMGDTCAGKI